MQCMRSLPEVWPKTTCPFSSLTRNVAWEEAFNPLTLHLDYIVLGHLRQTPGADLKLAFFNKDSYCCDIR